jgi:AcrR family transcriptional regulator
MLHLDPAKEERIINSAIKVFGESSFKEASTDEIVKEAGISKG